MPIKQDGLWEWRQYPSKCAIVYAVTKNLNLNRLGTACVLDAGGCMNIQKVWYQLTARMPRHLPQTFDQWAKLKAILHIHYGVPDEPLSWAAIAGQITSLEATCMRKSYQSLANAAKRLKVNQVAHDLKMIAYQENEANLKAKLQKAMENLANTDDTTLPKGPHSIQPDLQILQVPEAGVVHLPQTDGV